MDRRPGGGSEADSDSDTAQWRMAPDSSSEPPSPSESSDDAYSDDEPRRKRRRTSATRRKSSRRPTGATQLDEAACAASERAHLVQMADAGKHTLSLAQFCGRDGALVKGLKVLAGDRGGSCVGLSRGLTQLACRCRLLALPLALSAGV